ncbi:DUF4332 domain-containing protein [bacterium]|nr:DUF4332 domain-containing protein [bacterium]MCB1220763.1 DUF4332 domain-containing protein [bacterium]UNM09412.1 MAG: DUF4332 domain-containing protein [Planctomycetales bacterium]
MTRLTEIEQIGSSYVDRLEDAGVETVEALLAACRTAAGRIELGRRTGISENLLLGWAQRAELETIDNLSEEFADLIEAAGVGGLQQLAEFDEAELLELLERSNERSQIVIELPDPYQVSDWISQAKSLPRLIEY